MIGWLTLKAKLWAFLGALAAFLALILRNRYLDAARDRAEHRRDVAEAGIRRKQVTEEKEAEIDQKWSDWEKRANENLDREPDPPK